MIEALLVSTAAVAIGEIGDKTQLLAMLLAVRFKRPLPIIAGILVATLANHAVAGAVGSWVAAVLGPQVLRWVVGLSFIGMAAWMLVPDKADDDAAAKSHHGAFITTVVTFFLAEMATRPSSRRWRWPRATTTWWP